MSTISPFNSDKNNLQNFTAFCSRLKNPVEVVNEYTIANVVLTCYWADAVKHYYGTVLLIRAGYGAGRIRIADGQQELMDEDIFNVLENQSCWYSTGRSGSELIIDCPPAEEGIHRIDIEERTLPIPAVSQAVSNLVSRTLFV